jgi:hypothetical protein
VPISVEKAPGELRVSNLSQPSRNDGGFFQRVIPRSYEEWDYTYKNNHRNERKFGDCRPPLQPLPDIPLPKPLDVELEAIESKDYVVTSTDEYYKFLWEVRGTITSASCTKLFKPPDPENLMFGERFINDHSGSRRLPYSGPAPFPSMKMFETRTKRYCNDNFVWFVAEYEEPGKTIVSKFSSSGEFLYNIRMYNPKIADNKLPKSMIRDSIEVKDGYVYFWWNQSLPRPSNASEFPNRMTRFRFREPDNEKFSK